MPDAQRRRIIRVERFDEINVIRAHRIFPEQMAEVGQRAILTMRGTMTRELERARCLDGAAAVWSMWPGCLGEATRRVVHGNPLLSAQLRDKDSNLDSRIQSPVSYH